MSSIPRLLARWAVSVAAVAALVSTAAPSAAGDGDASAGETGFDCVVGEVTRGDGTSEMWIVCDTETGERPRGFAGFEPPAVGVHGDHGVEGVARGSGPVVPHPPNAARRDARAEGLLAGNAPGRVVDVPAVSGAGPSGTTGACR